MAMQSSSIDGDVVPGYRPVSLLAVAALVAGLISALALLSPVAWAVPLLAVGLAVAALRDVAARPGDPAETDAPGSRIDAKTGRWMAVLGLALALGFGAQAVAGRLVWRSIAGRRAESAARMFLEMVRQDRMADAYKCCLPQVMPMTMERPSMMQEPPTPEQTARKAEAALRGMEVIQSIQGCGADIPIELRCTGAEARMKDAWIVHVRVGPCTSGKTLRVRMLMESRPVARGQRLYDNWMVAGIAFEDDG